VADCSGTLNDLRSLPNLSVQQLDYLVAVHDAPTWADAAAAVGVTPSALSQGLSELERRLGVALFARDGRRRVPTTPTPCSPARRTWPAGRSGGGPGRPAPCGWE
jgi:hypothetical protein